MVFHKLEQYCKTCHNTDSSTVLLYKLKKIAQEQDLLEYAHVTILEKSRMENEWKELNGKKTTSQRKLSILSSLCSNVNNYGDESFVEIFETFVNVFKQVLDESTHKSHPVKTNENVEGSILRFSFAHKIAQHTFPFIENQITDPIFSKVDITLKSYKDDNSGVNSDFMSKLRSNTLEALSSIESSINQSFLNYERIPTANSSLFEKKFLSQVNETLKYEKVNSVLEKTLPNLEEQTLKNLQNSFNDDSTLSFVFGTPSMSNSGKIGTTNGRQNLFLRRDHSDIYLELIDASQFTQHYYPLEAENPSIEIHSQELLDWWRRKEFESFRTPPTIPKIRMQDVLLSSSLLMDPLSNNEDIVLSINSPNPKNPLFNLILAQSEERYGNRAAILKGEFQSNNLSWMGANHSKFLSEIMGTNCCEVGNIDGIKPIHLNIDLGNMSTLTNSFLDISVAHNSLYRQVFEDNNSSTMWMDFYIDNYHALNPMKDFSESILSNSSQYSRSFEILRENFQDHPDTMNNERLNNWISLMRSLIEKIEINRTVYFELTDGLSKVNLSKISAISELIMIFYEKIHLDMSELVENLKKQPIIKLFVMLLLTSSVGHKFYATVYPSFSDALKGRYFFSRFIESVLSELEDQDRKYQFQTMTKDIQLLSFLNVCLIGFRDNLFLSKLKTNRAFAMELVSGTQKINRSCVDSVALRLCKIPIGNSFMVSDRNTRNLLTFNHLTQQYEKLQFLNFINSNLLHFNVFMDSNKKEAVEQEHTLKAVNLRLYDCELVKKSYKFLDEQLKQVGTDLKPKLQGTGNVIPMDEKDDFDEILESLSNVCEVIVLPSEDAEQLTRSLPQVRQILLDSVPVLLFEMLHTFPDSLNQWLSYIMQQTMSFLKTLEGCQSISRQFKEYGERSIQIFGKGFVDMSLFLALQCSDCLVRTLKEQIEPFSKVLFEMCLLVECYLFQEKQNEIRKLKDLSTKLEQYASTLCHILSTDCKALSQSIKNLVGDEEFIGITQHFKVFNEDGFIAMLETEMNSFKKHVINERLLNCHLCMNQFYGEDIDSLVPLSGIMTYLSLPQDWISQDWREQLFLSLDFEGYADILQLVIDNCPKYADENAEASTLILLQQLALVLGNYPFHKLSNNESRVPYLHPILHASVVSKIASDPIIQHAISEMHSPIKLALGKLFDDMVRRCCQVKMEFNLEFIRSSKYSIIKSLHESYSLSKDYQSSNVIISDKLHNLFMKQYSKNED